MTFLTAEWRHLVMLNYVVDPELLRPLTPVGTELDTFNGQTFLSMVGFRFLRTRILGLPIPFHTDFEEVNLRFYVRRRVGNECRRGVVFIRELVPRFAIAFVARTFYGEPYLALPMRHEITGTDSALSVRYEWKHAGHWNSLRTSTTGEASPIYPGSEEEFITEHYWGYTAHATSVSEYQVEHPPWQTWKTTEAGLDCDIAVLYGGQFVETLTAQPASALVAEGSAVKVRYGTRLTTTSSPSG